MQDSTRIKFLCSMKDDEVEEILSYNELLDCIDYQDVQDTIEQKFKKITTHEGPLR